MNFGAADADILLTNRISDDVNVVTHIRQRVGHLPNARGGAVIGRERTRRHHGDRVAVRLPLSVATSVAAVSHVVITGRFEIWMG